MAAPAPPSDSIQATRGLYYFPEVGRDGAAAKIAEVDKPILRNSSVAGYYAYSYYDPAGALQHGLVRPALVDNTGRIIANTVPELIEMLRGFNPAAYVPTEPRPLGEDPMGGGGHRRRRNRKSRRTVRRQRR
jgi:hypothetical protein